MPEAPPARPVTVLSIDGGGMRGLIPALVLADLERRAGRPLWQLFDLVAGTSTGGLLALGLTVPAAGAPGEARYRARTLARLYEDEGPRIFRRSLWRRLRTATGLLEEKYRADGLEAVLAEYFGDARFSEALTEVMVTAYALERRKAYFFKRHAARSQPRERDALMRAAGRATCAAPTYFEPARVQGSTGEASTRTLVDGGVFAGNPAMCAYAEAVARFDPASVLVVSLGTGSDSAPISYRRARRWGAAGWARPLFDVASHGMSDTVDYQLRALLPPERYLRFQVRLREASGDLDDASAANRHALRRDARRLLRERAGALDTLATRLVALRE